MPAKWAIDQGHTQGGTAFAERVIKKKSRAHVRESVKTCEKNL